MSPVAITLKLWSTLSVVIARTFCIIIDYPVALSPLIAALPLKARSVIVCMFLSTDCYWQKAFSGGTNQSDFAAGQMMVQLLSRSLHPEIGFCSEPCTAVRMERMWAGRCISDEWAANLCKEACQFYLHEQLVVKEQCGVQQCLVFFSCDYWGWCEKCD